MDISYVEYVITPWIGWDCVTRILKKQISQSHHVTFPRPERVPWFIGYAPSSKNLERFMIW